MSMYALFKILLLVIKRPSNLLSIAFFTLLTGTLLLTVSEYRLITDVLTGTFPVETFFSILPEIVSHFFFSKGFTFFMHYMTISVLMGLYITLLLHIFIEQRYLSLSSFSTSIVGLSGIALGISCLSCGALAGLLLLSVFGAAGSSILVAVDSQPFLILGEALLLVSITISLFTIRKFLR